MTKILLIVSIICLEIGAFGMSDNEANASEHRWKIFYLIKKDVRKYQKRHLSNQRTVNNNWTNPVEALKSLGVLKKSSPVIPMFSQLARKVEKQSYRRILPAYPEWDEYINWDPKEPSASSSKATEKLESGRSSVDKIEESVVLKSNLSTENKFLSTEIISRSQLHQAYVQSCVSFYESFVNDQSAEARCRARLRMVCEQSALFTRRNYMGITGVSNTTASRDFDYGLSRGILREFGVIHGRKIYKIERGA